MVFDACVAPLNGPGFGIDKTPLSVARYVLVTRYAEEDVCFRIVGVELCVRHTGINERHLIGLFCEM